MPELTDDDLRVRQLSHYQLSWTAGESGANGTWTLQLVLDERVWEEVLTITADDEQPAGRVEDTKNEFYDIGGRVLMFGVTKTGD
jgi:hypothetical protein